MNSRDPATFRFGAYRLNPAARELFLDDERVALAPKVFDALLWLFEHRERAVGRDELAATVWGKADVTYTQLDQLIWYLRRGLGDNGTAQEVIRTVPRFGYRWVAEVEEIPSVEAPGGAGDTQDALPGESPSVAPSLPPFPTDEASPTDRDPPREPVAADAVPPSLPERTTSRHRALFALILVALTVMAVGLWWLRAPGPESPSAASSTASARTGQLVAVLPLQMDDIGNSEWAWLRLGLMDLIAERLRDGGVAVVPAHNVVALMGPEGRTMPSAATVRDVTHASIVVGAALGRSGEGWRLRISLDGMQGAAREIEVHSADPAQSAREAADQMLVLLGRPPVSERPGDERPDEDALIQRISAALHGNRVDMARALIGEAPGSLRKEARVQLLDADVLYRENRIAEALVRYEALADASSAAVGDSTRADALRGAGVIQAERGRFDDAIRRFNDAVELGRKNASAQQFGMALSSRAAAHFAQRDYEAAERDFAKARVALETIGDTLGLAQLEANEGGMLVGQRRFFEANALLTRSLERLERFPPVSTLLSAYNNKIYLDLALLDVPSALAVASKAQAALRRPDAMEPSGQQLSMQIIKAELAAGRYSESDTLLKAAASGVKSGDPLSDAFFFANHARLALERGNADEAVRWAVQADAVRSSPSLAAPHFASGRATTSLLHLRAAQAVGDETQAQAVLGKFEEWAGGQADPDVVAPLELARAEAAIHARQGEPDAQIVARFDAAMTQAARSTPATMALVASSYGRYLLSHERLDEAAVVIGRLANWAATDFDCALMQVELYHALGQPDAWRRALAVAQGLAGERAIPAALQAPPSSPQERARARSNLPVLSTGPDAAKSTPESGP